MSRSRSFEATCHDRQAEAMQFMSGCHHSPKPSSAWPKLSATTAFCVIHMDQPANRSQLESTANCSTMQCDALWHIRPVSEPDRQAKADVYALSMGRRVAGKAAWRGLVSVQDVLCALSWKVPVREAAQDGSSLSVCLTYR